MKVNNRTGSDDTHLVKVVVPKNILDRMMKSVPEMVLVPMIPRNPRDETKIYGVMQHIPGMVPVKPKNKENE